MIFSGARRFGLLLAGARWRWLVAALVASLVSVLVSVPVAGAAASPCGSPPAPPTFGEKLQIAILKDISAGIEEQSSSAAVLFGYVLDKFGLAAPDAVPECAVAQPKNELLEIQNRLTALETAVAQLRGEVAQSEYSVLVGQTSPITSNIDTGMNYLEAVADTPTSDPGKKELTDAALEFIKTDLLNKQQELATRITGEAGGDGLIKAFSKAMKTRSPFWTHRTSQQVREVYDYYQAEEARLLLLRVEYWHAKKFPKTFVATEVKRVEQWLGTPAKNGVPAARGSQEDLLKPSEVPGDFADTRSDDEWGYFRLDRSMTYPQAHELALSYHEAGTFWYLPTASQLQGLIAGYPGYSKVGSWTSWIDNETGGVLPRVSYQGQPPGAPGFVPDQVWVENSGCFPRYLRCTIFDREGKAFNFGNPDYPGNVLLVKQRKQTYWW